MHSSTLGSTLPRWLHFQQHSETLSMLQLCIYCSSCFCPASCPPLPTNPQCTLLWTYIVSQKVGSRTRVDARGPAQQSCQCSDQATMLNKRQCMRSGNPTGSGCPSCTGRGIRPSATGRRAQTWWRVLQAAPPSAHNKRQCTRSGNPTGRGHPSCTGRGIRSSVTGRRASA